ncbi:GLPGLI family protein [Moheibacter sediminis]|uniref:GLPGLI family protein n=1 Tax=Moheibacter sediminis TaxID=1434700 RepID=A0A1W2AVR1_9FLAO|nr:GLPGLI family protein [Moheibacter sediminis]SMC64531.1 GLPGLI family protein [Moheibacter sediminis]
MQRFIAALLLFASLQLAAQPKLNVIYKKETKVFDVQDSTKVTQDAPTLYYLNLTKTVSEYFLVTENFDESKYIPTNFLYKNMETNTYTQQLESGEYVHNSLPKLDWVLKPETKKILGYSVKKAILDLGAEKQVTAWYSNMTYQNGPENYHRLPGLILEIEVNEKINGQKQRTTFTAIAVDLSKNTKTISDPAKP